MRWEIRVLGGGLGFKIRHSEDLQLLPRLGVDGRILYLNTWGLSDMANTIENLDRARVLRQAREVWESEAAAKDWLQSPVRALGGKTPFEHLDTAEGRRQVSEVLRMIETGDFT